MRTLALCLACSIAYGEETKCVCPESPTNGARPGETVEQRVDRLETELRLSKAEAKVRRKGARR